MLSINEEEPGRTQEPSPIHVSGGSFAVVDKYKDLVYRMALTVVGNHADAEDVMQEVFFRYFRSHPMFENEVHERNWILKVTLNTGKNYARSIWNRNRTELDLDSVAAEQEQSGVSDVLRAVLSLPERYRVVIYLHYYEELRIAEIARILKVSESAAAKRLSRGREKLRKKLGGVMKWN